MPNLEVREAFSLQVTAELTEKGDVFTETSYRRLHEAFDTGDLQSVLITFQGAFCLHPLRASRTPGGLLPFYIFCDNDYSGF